VQNSADESQKVTETSSGNRLIYIQVKLTNIPDKDIYQLDEGESAHRNFSVSTFEPIAILNFLLRISVGIQAKLPLTTADIEAFPRY